MIYSMLSSRTKTPVSHAVLRALRERFGKWDNLRNAPIPEIEDTIRAVTFPERKAVQLKSALVSITQRCGSLDLGFLARYRTEKIRAWLEAFDGVGVKTSAAVVNFSTLRRRAMCVDSHHLRIVQRLGFVNKGATAHEAETRIMEMAPNDWSPEMLDDHHSLIKLHGQKCCTFADPHCSSCPLRDVCPTGSSSGSSSY